METPGAPVDTATVPRPRLRRYPEPRYLLRLWFRCVLIWILVRGAANSVGAELAIASGDRSSGLSWQARLTVVVIVLGIAYVFSQRQREMLFLQNLAVSRTAWAIGAAVPVLVAEVILAVLS